MRLKGQRKDKEDKRMKKKDKKYGRMIFYHIGDPIGIINETNQKTLRSTSMSKRKRLYKKRKTLPILGVFWRVYAVVSKKLCS